MTTLALHKLDRAALMLLQALNEHNAELRPYLETNHLETLHREIVALRCALLGLEMGPLYWEVPVEVVERLVNVEALPVDEVAARLKAQT